jgi:outer membrane protein assembly factor BamB
VHGQRLLFVSDDGYLYCVSTVDGKLHWRFRGGPAERWLLGNDRLVSQWPARGAPVTHGETVYFAAGIWPFMGIFVHAVDIASGQAVWTNSGSGSDYIVQQHNSPAFAGVAPQGYLAVSEDTLLVSGGMTVPAAFDRHSGQLLYFRPGDRQLGKDQGGYQVMIGPDWYANRGGLHLLTDGTSRVTVPADVLSEHSIWGIAGNHLVEMGTEIERLVKTTKDSRGKQKKTVTYRVATRRRARLPEGASQLHLCAGGQLVASDRGSRIFLLAKPQADRPQCDVLWQGNIPGTVWRALVSDDRLFVVSEEGSIHCFGSPAQRPAGAAVVHDHRIPDSSSQPAAAEPAIRQEIEAVLERVKQREGYALIDSPHGLSWAITLAAETQFHILLMEPDVLMRQRWREALADAKLLGQRVAVVPDTLASADLAPYFAELVVAHDVPESDRAATLSNAYSVLRPYGGTAVLGRDAGEATAMAQACDQAQLKGDANRLPNHFVLTRPGPLPGAGKWTSQNGDTGNTLVASEQNVRAPLGLLWFGGPSNRDVLPRHGHGPTPQVIGGRLFIEGSDMLRAVDVYTGRLLWQRQFKDVGIYYDNTDHHAGAGAIGGNFVTTSDSVYLAWGQKCLRLDPATGRTLAEFRLPPDAVTDQPYWGYIAVSGDHLIAGSSPMLPLTRYPGRAADKDAVPLYARFGEGSHRLVVMDRFQGTVQWTRDAQYNFRHNAIAIGEGKIFCLDRLTEKRLAHFQRRGEVPVTDASMLALELDSGAVVWQVTDDVFATWLAYDSRSRLLLQAGSRFRDRAEDELGKGMAVHDARDGQLLWRRDHEYGGPPMLYPGRIITQGKAYDLYSGEPIQRQHPLTDEPLPWQFTRNYGCCTAIGCTNLLTFRSAAAGYFDLERDGGTGNFGGFRTGCTANLIPADGVLSAPDYTRTCTCSYQNQCSLALIHMPEVEMWTFNKLDPPKERVKRLGINFGAPGDRRAEEGTLWLDYPSVGGPSPNVPISVTGQRVTYSRKHVTLTEQVEPRWVFASGLQGARKIEVHLAGSESKTSTQEQAGTPTTGEREPDGTARYEIQFFLRYVDQDQRAPVEIWVQGKPYSLASASTRDDENANCVVHTLSDI